MPLIDPKYNRFSQRIFDLIYALEDGNLAPGDPRPAKPVWWRRWLAKPPKYLMTFVDLAYSRAGFLFGQPENEVMDDFYGTFEDMCREIIWYYDENT